MTKENEKKEKIKKNRNFSRVYARTRTRAYLYYNSIESYASVKHLFSAAFKGRLFFFIFHLTYLY